jgi:hypothetical protein
VGGFVTPVSGSSIPKRLVGLHTEDLFQCEKRRLAGFFAPIDE